MTGIFSSLYENQAGGSVLPLVTDNSSAEHFLCKGSFAIDSSRGAGANPRFARNLCAEFAASDQRDPHGQSDWS